MVLTSTGRSEPVSAPNGRNLGPGLTLTSDGDEAPIVAPPASMTVDYERRPVLYAADGRALVRRPAGFNR